MNTRLLILADPYARPSYTPRLRYLCEYLVRNGYDIEVYTEQFESHHFDHSYSITEFPCFHGKVDWFIKSFWSLLTDWRNRHFSRLVHRAVKDKSYDLVFCTTFSTFPLRAALDIAQKKQIPLFVDIRDLDEQVPDAQYQAHRQWWARPFRKWYKSVNIHRRNKVLRLANCITTISPWHVDFLRGLNDHVHLVYNGYDPSQFYPENINNSEFLITYIGRIYEFQSTQLIEQIVGELNLPHVRLNWHTPSHNPISIHSVGDEIRKSSIMLVLTNPNAKGMMTTKFYEALGCEKPILCIPSDNGCLADTMTKTHAGLASSNVEEISSFILTQYTYWRQYGYTHQSVVNKIQFSREEESKLICQLFQKYLL